ncbi:MAG: hypothetical protein Q9M92_05320 [Enterobacterales bacterium]|nr:hypothetical protein [Enterobacterales bacterium]
MVTQFPKEILEEENTEGLSSRPASFTAAAKSNAIEKYKSDFLQRQKNIPFIEKIAYQDVTGGWFKLEINSLSLEKRF